ncbi:hypothetical protein BPAE_0125g00180 [Botrytis paeoniae]|uniref:Uncharacterized protein n=1 Tax=Botrytis paeoniae TaxID=278948 RepID=A0A4Z1FGW1_9HELO|nr:hypothetical protein BPAE_0125g00180 [Botrytis paeoniae]
MTSLFAGTLVLHPARNTSHAEKVEWRKSLSSQGICSVTLSQHGVCRGYVFFGMKISVLVSLSYMDLGMETFEGLSLDIIIHSEPVHMGIRSFKW